MSDGFAGTLNSQNEDYNYHDLSCRIYPTTWRTNKPVPPWGTLIHPDEVRRIMFVGNEPLMTTRGTQIEDFQLKNWIDMTVRAFAQEIEYDIYPRLWRSRPLPGEDGRFDLDPSTGAIEPFAEWDDPYDYDSTKASNFFLKLRRKPLCRLHRWVLAYPYTGSTFIDLTDKATPNYRTGILRAVYTRAPWGNLAPPSTGLQAWRGMQGSGGILPGAYRVDYTTGFDHASRVPDELKNQILKFFLISLMSSYGEGIIGGVSNYSTSVGVINESLGTTMSAENSFYGARIKQFATELKEWWKVAKPRYTGLSFGALG